MLRVSATIIPNPFPINLKPCDPLPSYILTVSLYFCFCSTFMLVCLSDCLLVHFFLSFFQMALNCGQKEAFRLLLKHGADPNIRTPPKERSLYMRHSYCYPSSAIAVCPCTFIWWFVSKWRQRKMK